MPTVFLQKIRLEGIQARMMGKTRSANPYIEAHCNSDMYLAWNDGYIEADAEQANANLLVTVKDLLSDDIDMESLDETLRMRIRVMAHAFERAKLYMEDYT